MTDHLGQKGIRTAGLHIVGYQSREVDWRCAKALVSIGAGGTTGHDRLLGHLGELLVVDDPGDP